MDNGWEASAAAWIRDQGDHGDFGRRYVLDPVMLERATQTTARTALDVGCGEGRFCRLLAACGLDMTGLEPTPSLLAQARRLHPHGRYVEAKAESLPFADGAFDLVISYLSLIDIQDIRAAIPEMVRVLKPGGRLLTANLTTFTTAGMDLGWIKNENGEKKYFALDRYSEERAAWLEYRDIRILNYHRPLGAYFRIFLAQGLQLTLFDEPLPTPEAPRERAIDYGRAPWFCVMEWAKPDPSPRLCLGNDQPSEGSQ